jgi:hypothetical protein
LGRVCHGFSLKLLFKIGKTWQDAWPEGCMQQKLTTIATLSAKGIKWFSKDRLSSVLA